MNQDVKPIARSTDIVSDKLFDKCVDRLTGADKLAELIDGVMANTISRQPKSFDDIMRDIGNSLDNFEPALFKIEPFTMQPFEWPRYLDRSCMVNIDVTKTP